MRGFTVASLIVLVIVVGVVGIAAVLLARTCLLYTSDAADE